MPAEDEEEQLNRALELSRQEVQGEVGVSTGEQWEETPADEAGGSNNKRRKFH